MPRGGLNRGKASDSNHLFKPKWNNKKTTAIRIPEAFEKVLLGLARCFDKVENISQKNQVAIVVINLDYSSDDNIHLITKTFENPDLVTKEIFKKLSNESNQNSQENQQDKYKIAVECFDEFLKSRNLNIEDLSKSRKGTKNHQLFEIDQWFKSQSVNSD